MTNLEIIALILIVLLILELSFIYLLKSKRHAKIKNEIAKIVKKQKL